MLEILRRPDAAVELEFNRRVFDQGGGVEAAGLERGQIHRRLHERTDRPPRIKRAVEAVRAHIAATDDGHHITAVRLGNDQRAFEVRTAYPARGIEALQIQLQCALRGRLRARIEARVHGKARGSEIRLGVVALQMAPDQIEIGGYVTAAGRHQPKRGCGGALRSGGVDQMRLGELLQHEIAPRARAVGMFARIVIGRPFDHPDQHRDFTGIELGERLGEVILAAESEAMDCTRTVLAEIHLVEVGDEDFLFGEMRLEPRRHDRLGRLPVESLLVRQEVILDELLRQRAATLHHVTGPQVRPQRAHDTARIDAVMLVEAPVLDQFDAGAQQRRHVGGRQHQAVFTMDREYAADHGRIEAEHGQLRAIGRLERGDRVRVRADGDELRFPQLVAEAHAARMQIEGVFTPPIDPGGRRRVPGAVVEAVEFLFEIGRRDLRTGVELERRGVDARRNGPVPTLEFPGHDAVEVHDPGAERGRQNDAHQDERHAEAKQLGTRHASHLAEQGVQIDLPAIADDLVEFQSQSFEDRLRHRLHLFEHVVLAVDRMLNIVHRLRAGRGNDVAHQSSRRLQGFSRGGNMRRSRLGVLLGFLAQILSIHQ